MGQLDMLSVGKPVQVELKVKSKLSTRPYVRVVSSSVWILADEGVGNGGDGGPELAYEPERRWVPGGDV
jgi:hypothetical protein